MDAAAEAIGAPSPLIHAIAPNLVPVIDGRETRPLPSFPGKREAESPKPLTANLL